MERIMIANEMLHGALCTQTVNSLRELSGDAEGLDGLLLSVWHFAFCFMFIHTDESFSSPFFAESPVTNSDSGFKWELRRFFTVKVNIPIT